MPGRIGVFDSGIGGLTVVKEVVAALPGQDLVFLGDTARVPYGTRGREVIARFARELAAFLLRKDVDLLVAACNTISSTCLEALAAECPVPLLGVVDPAVSEAVRLTRSGRIGIIGTRATVGSGVYETRIRAAAPGVRVFSQACPLFVPLAEEGLSASPATRLIAEDYLRCLRDERVDVLILGCTHYPLLRDVIAAVMGPDVTLVDSAAPLAAGLAAGRASLQVSEREAEYEFYVTDAPGRVSQVAGAFFGGSLPAPLQLVRLDAL